MRTVFRLPRDCPHGTQGGIAYDKTGIFQEVKNVLAAPSACPELKEACEAYLAAVDTEGEQAAYDALITELKEDVCTAEDYVGFTASEHAKQIFGEEAAEKMHEEAVASLEAGGKWCLCPACQAGGKILESI